MLSLRVWLLVLLLTGADGPGAAPASGDFCGGAILSVGESRADVLIKCGEPDWKESRQEEIAERIDGRTVRTTLVNVEEWTYNVGPQQFLRIVTLRNGRVADIRLGDYGQRRDGVPGPEHCGGRIVSRGESKGEVLAKCGEPDWRDSRTEETAERDREGNEFRSLVTVEEWTYNLGPGRFLRIYVFRNGVLADVKTGGYGTDKRRGGRP